MPRVTEEYRATRRAEIVDAAALRFAANGFHSTSMADIISESGLSAGAVYRYFRSKEEIVAAVAELALLTADEIFAKLLAGGAAPSPAETVTAVVEGLVSRQVREGLDGIDLARIAVQVWSEALRNPELSVRVGGVYLKMRDYFAEVARRRQAIGKLPADAVPDEVGAAMLSLVQGFVLQNLLVGDTTAPTYLAGVRALLSAQDA